MARVHVRRAHRRAARRLPGPAAAVVAGCRELGRTYIDGFVHRGHDVHRAVDLHHDLVVHDHDRADVDDVEQHHDDGTEVDDLDDGDDQTALTRATTRRGAQGALCELWSNWLWVDASRLSAWSDSVLASVP